MKRHNCSIFLCLSLFLCLAIFGLARVSFAQQGEITVVTYYPQPMGAHHVLRLQPQTSAPLSCDGTNPGSMYYNQSDGNIYFCGGTQWTVPTELWEASGTNLYPLNTNRYVGLGVENWVTTPMGTLNISNVTGSTNTENGIFSLTNGTGHARAYGLYSYTAGGSWQNNGMWSMGWGGATTYGVMAVGRNATNENYGAYAYASGNSSYNYGVYGYAYTWNSPAGTNKYTGYFEVTSSPAGSRNYGVYAEAGSAVLGGTNYAFYAYAPTYSGYTSYGLYAQAGSSYFGGKVGIGTTTPSAYAGLDIRNSEPTGNRGQIITDTYWIRNTTGNAAVPTGGRAWIDHNNDDLFICQYNTVANKGIQFVTPFGQVRMTILSSNGNVGIGVTIPTYKLHVSGGNAYKTLGAGSWTYPSDIRLKKNVHPIENALDKLLKLKGVTFQWKEPKEHGSGTYMGMIGQEVEQVFPEWVSTDKQGYKNLNVIGFEALTAEAVKELKKENEILKVKSAELAMRARVLEEKLIGKSKER